MVTIPKKKQSYLWLTIIVIGLSLYLTANIFFIIFGQINADEGWYLYASRLVFEGQKPYQDFAYTQSPLLPYVYGVIQNFISAGLYAGRITTFLLSTTAMIFAMATAWRYADKKAAAITLLLWTTFAFGIYYHSITKTYALLTLFFVLTFFVLSSNMRPGWKAMIVTSLVLLAALTRLSALFFAVPILLYEFISAPKKVKFGIILLCVLAGAWMAFLSIPKISPLWWNLIGHHTGQWGDLSVWGKIQDIFNYRLPSLVVVFPGYILLVITLLAVGFRQIKTYISQNRDILLILVALMCFALPHFITGGFHMEYFASFIFCMFPIIGILYTEVDEQKQGYRKLWVEGAMICALLLGLLLGGLSFVDTEGWRQPVAQVKAIAEVVSANSEPGDAIFAMEALWVAVEAERHTLPHMSMAQFSFTKADRETANSLKLINGQIILDYLDQKVPKIVVLTDLDWEIFEKTDEFEQITAALDEHYDLLLQESDFGQSGEGVEVYLRREDP